MIEKEEKPLVSIIMNCFNGELFLRDALKSVLDQTYSKWELIFWDNQSKDKSADILKNFNEDRFKYFYSDHHTSLYKARNLAIEKSKGEFIAFLDVDDLWEKNKLEFQLNLFNDPKVGLVYSNLWILKKNTKIKKLFIKKKLPSGNIYNNLLKNYNIGILTVMIRKKSYIKLNKKFDERFTMIGDFDLFLKFSKDFKFESVQIPLASYRLHGKNLSTLNKEKEINEYKLWLDENKKDLKNDNIESFQKYVDYKKFVNYKMNKNYLLAIKMLFNSKINPLNVKNIVMLLLPIALIKKIFWWHQE